MVNTEFSPLNLKLNFVVQSTAKSTPERTECSTTELTSKFMIIKTSMASTFAF